MNVLLRPIDPPDQSLIIIKIPCEFYTFEDNELAISPYCDEFTGDSAEELSDINENNRIVVNYPSYQVIQTFRAQKLRSYSTINCIKLNFFMKIRALVLN